MAQPCAKHIYGSTKIPTSNSQFSAECRPPVPARKAMLVWSGLPGTVQPVPADNHRRFPLHCGLTVTILEDGRHGRRGAPSLPGDNRGKRLPVEAQARISFIGCECLL
jgi:hypothetical protein